MKKTKITKTVTQLITKIPTEQFDTFNEMLKEEYLADIIVTEENKKIVVYCLTAEVKDVIDAIEQYEECEEEED
jgi:hypothetical protein